MTADPRAGARRHLLSGDDLDREAIERILEPAADSRRWPSARSRSSRHCAAAPS